MKFPSPYLLEYRAAKAVMSLGNPKAAKLLAMASQGEVFFFEDDKKDFAACPLCGAFCSHSPSLFLKASVKDMSFRRDLSAKLVAKGMLVAAKQFIAEPSIKFTAVGARKKLCCVVAAGNSQWDSLEVCNAAALPALSITDFTKGL